MCRFSQLSRLGLGVLLVAALVQGASASEANKVGAFLVYPGVITALPDGSVASTEVSVYNASAWSYVARFYFWASIHWGAWSRSAGLLAAVREGVANRIHDYLQVTLELEPGYDRGGPHRMLSTLHRSLPRECWRL